MVQAFFSWNFNLNSIIYFYLFINLFIHLLLKIKKKKYIYIINSVVLVYLNWTSLFLKSIVLV